MKRHFVRNSVLSAVLLAAAGAFAQSGQDEGFADQVHVQVLSLTLQNLSTTKLVIGVRVAAISRRNVTVDQIVFSGLRVNGIPIYAEPFKHRFKLRSGASVMLPEPFSVTVYLRDLNSLQALRGAIADGHATLQGVATVHVPLNPVAAVMLLSRHAEVSTTLHEQLPVSIPGGQSAARSLLKIFDLAGAGFQRVGSTVIGAIDLDP